jgi:hypothetical protein
MKKDYELPTKDFKIFANDHFFGVYTAKTKLQALDIMVKYGGYTDIPEAARAVDETVAEFIAGFSIEEEVE